MLTYNTQLPRLTLPEYGRNIQRMVDYCLTIPDRDERTACAHSIVATMSTLFPSLRATPGFKQKLWDHLAILSDFQLDIDYPVEVIRPDSLGSGPDPVPYSFDDTPRRRHYGKYLERMAEVAAQMPEGEEREALSLLLANQMKKLMLSVAPDGVDDVKIFKDLREISHGAIVLDPQTHRLFEFQAAPQPSSKKKKKK